jgi:small conductance mechanosensitive channel
MPAPLLATAEAGIGTPDWLRTNGVRILVVVLLAVAVSRLGAVTIRRMRRRLDSAPTATGAINLRRTTTIMGIVTSAFRVVVWTIVGFLILGEIGIDLGPLIAGAGIVGVALGFGAQSLVRDFLSGFFILLENQFTVGDAVDLATDVGGVHIAGRVEALTLRTTAVRSDDGTLLVVPNGNLHVVANRSRGQSSVEVEIHVPRGEDLEHVRALVAGLCGEMRADERLSGRLFSGPDVVGVEQVNPDTVSLRVRAETTPARAEELKSEITLRLERRFAPVPQQRGRRRPRQLEERSKPRCGAPRRTTGSLRSRRPLPRRRGSRDPCPGTHFRPGRRTQRAWRG